MRFERKHAVSMLAAAAVAGLDQYTKRLVVDAMAYGETREVLPFLNLKFVHNAGSAFGFMATADEVVRMVYFAVLGLAAVFMITILALRAKTVLALSAYTLVFGGAAGNFIDRLRGGSVVDFIDLHAGGFHWWVFNVADVAITAGVVLLLVEGYLLQKAPKESHA